MKKHIHIQLLATCLTAGCLSFTIIAAQAQNDVSADNLTVEQTAHLKGTARFGTLGEDVNMDGLRVEIFQSSINRLRQVLVPATDTRYSELQPIMDWRDLGFNTEYGHTVYDWVEVTPYMAGYYSTPEPTLLTAAVAGYEVVDTPAVAYVAGVAAVAAVYGSEDTDGDGIDDTFPEISPAIAAIPEIPAVAAVTHWVDEIPATYQTYQPVWTDSVSATYDSVPRWVVDNIIHTEDLRWVQVGEQLVNYGELVAAHYTSEPYVEFAAPVARFSGTRPGMSFAWSNWNDTSGSSRRDLMTLSDGGLLFPSPGDADGRFRASLAHDQFEQSWKGPHGAGYESIGTRMKKDEISIWDSTGEYAGGAEVERAIDATRLTSTGVLVAKRSQPSGGGTEIRSTHITADFASFGGGVNVKGVLRVAESGDLSMGEFSVGTPP